MTPEELKELMLEASDLVPEMPSDEWSEVLAELITKKTLQTEG